MMRVLTLLICLMVAAAATPKNVLVMLVDDLGSDFTSQNTDPTAEIPPMPNIDGLASNGIRFQEFRTMAACAASRASLLTGRHNRRNGVILNSDSLAASEYTMAEDLRDNHGYATGMVGKWNLGAEDGNDTPRTRGGFDYFSGSYPVSGFSLLSHFSWNKTVNGSAQQATTTYSLTDQINDAIAWTGTATEPWFMYACFHVAHKAGAIDQYPPNDLHSYGGTPGANGGITAYRAMIEATDTEVGRLLATVDYADTIVVFLGDNGSTYANGTIPSDRIKGSMYDNGVRSPLIIRAPGVDGGVTSSEKVHMEDLYPTLVKLATDSQNASPNTLDGRDFSGVFRGEIVPQSRPHFFTDGGTSVSASDGNYRLLDKATGDDEFYHVASDPYEQSPLIIGSLTGEALKAYQNLRYALTTYTANEIEPEVSTNYAQPSAVTGGIRVVSGGTSVSVPTVGSATITCDEVAGATAYTLWKKAGDFAAWEDTGLTPSISGGVVTFTDPSPSGRPTYRITNDAPEP